MPHDSEYGSKYCYTDFWLRPRLRSAYFSSIAGTLCTVADNSGRPGLCSAERGDLFVPWTRTTTLRRRSFFITAPVVWNSLPLHLRSPSISRSQFRAGLKTHIYRLAFHWLFLWELLKRLNWTDQYRFRQCVVDPRVEIRFTVDCLVVAELCMKHELDLAQSRFGRWKIDLRQV